MTFAALSNESYINENKYLSDELTSDIKHEYIDGVIYAMVDPCSNHVTI